MRQQGTIVRWDAARGFGFIRSAAASADIFFHAKDVRGTAAPHEGLLVTFEEIHVGGKGPRAMAVQTGAYAPRVAPIGAPARRAPVQAARSSRSAKRPQHLPRRSTVTPTTGPALLLMPAWTVLIGWGIWAGRLPMLTLAIALLLNLITFFVYWTDKYAAQKGRWRTAENTLHLLGLLGGWPGAWFAQHILRHKSSKESFRATYWTTVVLHCMVLAGWLLWSPLHNPLLNTELLAPLLK